jgi:hypothetical protein
VKHKVIGNQDRFSPRQMIDPRSERRLLFTIVDRSTASAVSSSGSRTAARGKKPAYLISTKKVPR